MISSLSIQNVVLIDRLTLEGESGLCALTGETGAGKSILLDALGLALGGRADAGLVRHGTESASVTAAFDLPAKHPAFSILKDKEIEAGDQLILRRILNKDGRSKAYINDINVSVQLLKEIGSTLVEIHGQFETMALLDPAEHVGLLDAFGGNEATSRETRAQWAAWRAALTQLESAKAEAKTIAAQEDYLRHAVKELEDLSPQAGEETLLAEKRTRLLNRDKMRDAVASASEALDGEDGILNKFARVQSLLSKAGLAEEALTTARVALEELSYQLGKQSNDDDESLEDIEERYFALRGLAKKHHCNSDDLAQVLQDLSAKLRLITHQEDALSALEKNVETARTAYIASASALSDKRRKAATKLAKAVNAELPDLKLEKATFSVVTDRTEKESDWNASGIDRVHFAVATNPGAPAAPLHKTASGGEMSRLMLALKVILAETGSAPTLIFDEADSGIGGATADAVGERFARLAKRYQVLAVTHSPQVAARASHHWVISKKDGCTRVKTLSVDERREEIARMLSGAEVTVEARAAAQKLLENHAA